MFCTVAAIFVDEKVVSRQQQKRFFQLLLVVFIVQISMMYIMRGIHTDTYRYLRTYDTYVGMSMIRAIVDGGKEAGFTLFSWAASNFGVGHRYYLGLVFFLGLIPFGLGLRKYYGRGWGYVLIVYTMYPFFISYFASGLRQAIAMAIVFWGVIGYAKNKKLFRIILIVLLGSLFHLSVLVVFPAILALHYAERWLTISKVMGIWVIVCLVSMLGLNEQLLGFLSGFFDDSSRYQYYLDSDKIDEVQQALNYRTGFRLDFTLFSILPILYVLYFERRSGIDLWLIKYYLIVNCAWQLLTFTASNDRFAALSWFYIPTILIHSQFYENTRKSTKLVYYILLFSGLLLLVLFNKRYFL